MVAIFLNLVSDSASAIAQLPRSLLKRAGSFLKFWNGNGESVAPFGVDLSSGTNREAKSIWKTPQSLR